MRVIAGTARSLPLVTLPGKDTRPTTDRIKETLFNILQPEVFGCNFLDLFAGSGAIGIEALSRGAKRAVFVEKNRKACSCIRQNLQFTRLEDGASVLNMDVLQALASLEGKETFDLIFADPPYQMGVERQLLERLKDSSLAGPDSTIVIEADRKTDFGWVREYGFAVRQEKCYKTNKHVFIERKGQ